MRAKLAERSRAQSVQNTHICFLYFTESDHLPLLLRLLLLLLLLGRPPPHLTSSPPAIFPVDKCTHPSLSCITQRTRKSTSDRSGLTPPRVGSQLKKGIPCASFAGPCSCCTYQQTRKLQSLRQQFIHYSATYVIV